MDEEPGFYEIPGTTKVRVVYYTISQAAEVLGVTPGQLRRILRERGIEHPRGLVHPVTVVCLAGGRKRGRPRKRKPQRWTKDQTLRVVRYVAGRLRDEAQFARAMKVDLSTVQRWFTGDTSPQPRHWRRLRWLYVNAMRVDEANRLARRGESGEAERMARPTKWRREE